MLLFFYSLLFEITFRCNHRFCLITQNIPSTRLKMTVKSILRYSFKLVLLSLQNINHFIHQI